jgi:hypothetical protein
MYLFVFLHIVILRIVRGDQGDVKGCHFTRDIKCIIHPTGTS